LKAIQGNDKVTYDELINGLGLSLSTISRAIRELKKQGFISRQGSDKTGKWIVLKSLE
jgi:predicted HTH transcriptional regulator